MGGSDPSFPDVRGAAAPAWTLLSCFLGFGLASLWSDPLSRMERALVLRRGWVPEPAFRNLRAFSRVAPGLQAVTLALVLGRRLGGRPGATAAFIGMIGAPAVAAVLFGAFLSEVMPMAGTGSGDIAGEAAVQARMAGHGVAMALLGVAAASAGVAVASGFGGLFRIGPTPGVLLVAGFMIMALLLWHWPLVLIVPAALPLGLLVCRRRARGGGHG